MIIASVHTIRIPAVARGFNLIELMVALTLGVLLSIGLVSLFSSTANMNRVQEVLGNLQENGRFAMTTISNDLRMGSGQYCANTGGLVTVTANADQDFPRAPFVYYDTTNFPLDIPDYNNPPASLSTKILPPPGWAANTAFPLSPRFFLQGYSCPNATCTPLLPTATAAFISPPAIGTVNGRRPAGSDVLTIRYVRSRGWSIFENGSSQTCNATGQLTQLLVKPYATDPAFNFQAGDLALLGDCSGSEIIGVTYTPGNPATFVPTKNFAITPPPCVQTSQDSRIFNFTRDFVTVTYYLQLDNDPNVPGRMISSLYRGVNTGVAGAAAPQQVVQGVERLNFLYNVQDSNGLNHLYTAAQVSTNPDALTCPPPPVGYTAVAESGCLWRAVRSVEVFMLLNTIDDMAANAADMSFRYSFNAAGAYVGLNAGNQPAPPPATLVSGLPRGNMMRREFRSLVSLHNYIP